jgi:hypothetical protein
VNCARSTRWFVEVYARSTSASRINPAVAEAHKVIDFGESFIALEEILAYALDNSSNVYPIVAINLLPAVVALAMDLRAPKLTRHSLVAEALGGHTMPQYTETSGRVHSYRACGENRCRWIGRTSTLVDAIGTHSGLFTKLKDMTATRCDTPCMTSRTQANSLNGSIRNRGPIFLQT